MYLVNKFTCTVKRGDTIIEVSFAIAIFALVSVISIALMNSGIAMSEATLEYTMARNEIDAQAEAIRFIQNSYYAEFELVSSQHVYENLWKKIVEKAIDPNNSDLSNLNADFGTCNTVYGNNGLTNSMLKNHAFVINTRSIKPTDVTKTVYNAWASDQFKNFRVAQMHPRIVYNSNNKDLDLIENNTTVRLVEGLWVIVVRSNNTTASSTPPEFYDFHIRACWYSPSSSGAPSSIATVIRLYNPEYHEAGGA